MSANDKELLELAAKAAGLTLGELGGRIVRREVDGQPVYWNPLTDDGDALRLAVKLGLTVVVESDMVFCRNQRFDKAFREQGKDLYAATRRAIVRAAAEIGRMM